MKTLFTKQRWSSYTIKVDFRVKKINRDKEESYVMIKMLIH